MAYVDKINVQGTDYDINDKRLPKVNGVVTLDDNFTANDITEKMTGYSIYSPTVTNLTKDYDYAGVVKNGNKLTMVLVGRLTRTDSVSNDVNLIEFYVPQSVANKLYPSTIGELNYLLDAKVVNFFENNYTSTPCHLYLQKTENAIAILFAIPNTELTVNKEYYFRIEVTFLLSDNLIQ